MCVDMCADVCADMCADMCMDMHAGMRVGMHVDMHVVDLRVDICMDVCMIDAFIDVAIDAAQTLRARGRKQFATAWMIAHTILVVAGPQSTGPQAHTIINRLLARELACSHGPPRSEVAGLLPARMRALTSREKSSVGLTSREPLAFSDCRADSCYSMGAQHSKMRQGLCLFLFLAPVAGVPTRASTRQRRP